MNHRLNHRQITATVVVRTDSEGKRIPEGWSREEWEKLTSQQRTHVRAGSGFGMTIDGGDED